MINSICLKSVVKIYNTGVTVELPVIVTRDGVHHSFLKYMVINRARSRSWQDKSVLAIRSLLDHAKQNEHVFDNRAELFRDVLDNFKLIPNYFDK